MEKKLHHHHQSTSERKEDWKKLQTQKRGGTSGVRSLIFILTLVFRLKLTLETPFLMFNISINPFSASPIFGQVQNFFLENLLLAWFLCWRDISRDLFFFREGLKFFFHINMKK